MGIVNFLFNALLSLFFGRVKNHKGRITSGSNHESGYLWVSISPKQYLLHRLVAQVFIPNTENKKSLDYMKNTPSFFSIEAMEYLVSLGVQHLLVDTPSVDRLFDNGHLTAHNIFWETKEKVFNPNSKNKTITEMIFAPDSLMDGVYLLNLQIPAFVSDAAPSRPILYKINEL